MINQSISNAIRCLELLASSENPMGIREMGRILDMDPAKVTRIMKTLVELDLVSQSKKRKYTVGWGLNRLSALSIHNSKFYKSVITTLESVDTRLCTIAIGVLGGDKVVYLVHTGKSASVAQSIGNYDSIPASSSVIGIMLLSRKNDEEITDLIGAEEFALLRDEIEAARNSESYIKSYPFNEYRIARQLPDSNAVIALSNIRCKESELPEYVYFLSELIEKIKTE
ncbi:helix-turn-helix domain-containing protein [Halomonas dongshanensis]|uniref:Helix-turn-helix domain-containing protein n=1 Tax=Halomonas dongshanensis TaxID=2890835 RepID=A0ABT2EF38_9GAMM|nr:helix-turn-helix domain-containing protein [Halomonas dongshanensis]MCS2609229.1 helix-turn-helix domain-containing protein [Halomonas dongshanensis]